MLNRFTADDFSKEGIPAGEGGRVLGWGGKVQGLGGGEGEGHRVL
jgi:hypothetical protein